MLERNKLTISKKVKIVQEVERNPTVSLCWLWKTYAVQQVQTKMWGRRAIKGAIKM